MIPRVVKRETATQLELTLKLFVDTVQLRLDKVLCLKCDICARVCPRDAVRIIPGDDGLDISILGPACVAGLVVLSTHVPLGKQTITVVGDGPAPVGAVEAGHWEELIGSNLRAPFFLAQEAAPALAKRGVRSTWRKHSALRNITPARSLRPQVTGAFRQFIPRATRPSSRVAFCHRR